MHSLMENAKLTRVLDNQTAATSSKGTTVLDMQGYDGVVFFTALSVGHASNNYMKVQQSGTNTTASMADLLGTKIQSTASALQLWADIYRPRERYVRAVIIRATSLARCTTMGDMSSGASRPPMGLRDCSWS